MLSDHPNFFSETIDYWCCPLLDDEPDNVLQYVDATIERIVKYQSKGKNVLVHCVCGVSRSVALTTAFIMKTQSLSFDEAYEYVQSRYKMANMAWNFQEQLRRYGSEFKWDMRLNTQLHRLYRTTHRLAIEGCQNPIDEPACRYICKKCRHCLFLDIHVLSAGSAENHHIECMHWMSDNSERKGQITCPGCGAKLGHFDWAGVLGDFTAPGFIVTASKVDCMPLTSAFRGDPFPRTRY